MSTVRHSWVHQSTSCLIGESGRGLSTKWRTPIALDSLDLAQRRVVWYHHVRWDAPQLGRKRQRAAVVARAVRHHTLQEEQLRVWCPPPDTYLQSSYTTARRCDEVNG